MECDATCPGATYHPTTTRTFHIRASTDPPRAVLVMAPGLVVRPPRHRHGEEVTSMHALACLCQLSSAPDSVWVSGSVGRRESPQTAGTLAGCAGCLGAWDCEGRREASGVVLTGDKKRGAGAGTALRLPTLAPLSGVTSRTRVRPSPVPRQKRLAVLSSVRVQLAPRRPGLCHCPTIPRPRPTGFDHHGTRLGYWCQCQSARYGTHTHARPHNETDTGTDWVVPSATHLVCGAWCSGGSDMRRGLQPARTHRTLR